MFRKILKFLLGLLLIPIILLLLLQKASIAPNELNEKYAKAPSLFVEIDGMQVHYRIQGEGDPVLLIHGTGAALFTWNEWADSLSQYYKVITMDLPAFGLTGPSPDEDYSMYGYVDFIDHFVMALGIDTSFVLGGNSLGGGIAWQYALRHPDKVAQLLLLSPSESPKRKVSKNIFSLIKPSAIPGLNSLLTGVDTKWVVALAMKNAYHNTALIKPEKQQMYYEISMREGNRMAFLKRMEMTLNDPMLNTEKVKTPTLIQWGENDKVLPIAQLEGFKSMTNATFIKYPNVGHSPQEEIPSKSVHDAILYLKKFHQ